MKLYHGTSESKFAKIRTTGLRPRSKKAGNWDKFPSRSDMVYLTTAYAVYFGIQASEDERIAVIEVDTDWLPPSNFYPDEDFIAQVVASRRGVGIDEVHQEIREDLEIYQQNWELSIENLGNCCYKGLIPPDAMTRVAFFDIKKRPTIAMMAMDPMISIMNYRLCSKKYIGLISWIFGDSQFLVDDFSGFDDKSEMMKKRREYWERQSQDREGIEVCKLPIP